MKLNIFYRYLFSYALMFLIPLIILGSMIYYNSVTNLQHEVVSSNTNNLIQVNKLIEQQYRGLEHTAAQIAVDPLLLKFRVRSEGFSRKEAVDELARYQSSNAFSSNLYLYYRGDQLIYSGAGFSQLDTFTSRQYQFEDWDNRQFYNDLNGADQAVVKPAKKATINNNETKRVITYIFPIPIHDPYPQGAVVYFVDEAMLTDLIWNVIGDYEGGVYVLNADGSILASRDRGLGLAGRDLDTVVANAAGSAVTTIRLGDQELSAVSTHSAITGWTLVTVMPTDQFFNRVIEKRTFVFYVMTVLFMTGFALAVLFSRTYYKPIRKTAELTRKYWGQVVHPKRQDELGRIEDTIMTAYQSQRDLESQILKQRPFVRDQFLLNLLRGGALDPQEISRMLDSESLSFAGGHYFVLVAEWNRKGEAAPAALADRRQFPEGISYGIELMMGNLALICHTDRPSEEVQKQFVRHVLELLREQAPDMQPAVGVGRLYNDITLINRSYVEATAAIEYKIKVDRGTPIYFADIQDYENSTHWYPLKEQYKLAQSLKQGDGVVARETLTEMIRNIKSQGQSFLLMKCMCFDIINTILKIINELRIEELSDRIKELVEYRTLEELEEQLKALIADICERIGKAEESGKQELIHRIEAYIRGKYTSDQLNLDEAAERFHLSPSYFSRFFKEQTGFTFTDYVIHLRIEDVKRQLVRTDKPIKEIILNSGYNNVSSFSRRFKQIEGITPGQYREIMSQHQDAT